MTEQPKTPAAGRTNRGVWWILIAMAAIAVVLILLPHRPAPTSPQAPTAQAPQASQAKLPAEVTVAEAAGMRDRGAFVVDVRQPEEWKEGHLEGATLIPLDDLESRLAEVPRDRAVLVVCHSGNRSKKGRDILLQAGYPEVASMSGGLGAWEAEGRPTVKGM